MFEIKERMNFDNYEYIDGNGYLGGYLDTEINLQRKNITPDIAFQIDLNKSYNFLENYISQNEFDRIRDVLHKFNQKLFKNPTLILLSFIVVKQSKKTSIDAQRLKQLYSNPGVVPLIKENNISIYDILRYCRYYILHIPEIANAQY